MQLAENSTSTFNEYAEKVFVPYLSTQLEVGVIFIYIPPVLTGCKFHGPY